MGISLRKGEGISLRKDEHDLSKLTIGLGWDVADKKSFLGGLFSKQEEYDLDAVAFMLDAAGKFITLGLVKNGQYTLNGGDVVFYNSLKHPSGKIWLTGDNRTGAGDGDDEQIVVLLNDIPREYERIVFITSIYDGIKKNQNFGAVKNAFIRAVDAKGREVCRYDVSGDASFSRYHSITFAEVFRDGGGWKFRAVGTPHETDRFTVLMKQYLS